MTLQEIDTQLDQIKSAIAQWQAQGYTPTIEKNIVLHKMQQVYDGLSCGKAIVSEAPVCDQQEGVTSGAGAQVDNNVIIDIYNRFEQISNDQEQFYSRIEQISDAQMLIVKSVEAQVQEGEQIKNRIEELVSDQIAQNERVIKPIAELEKDQTTKTDSFVPTQVAPLEKSQSLVFPEDKPQPLVLPDEKPQPLILPEEKQTVAPVAGVLILGQNISVAQKNDFIRELFCKDELFFANEIRKFQQVGSLDDALIYIGEKYNWSANNIYAGQFIGLLENYYK